jgi:ectoine hydroxylase-related dioxygenase (phytanoyl-CoA dioxygenase family)
MYENLYEKIVGALVENGYVVLENALDNTLAKGLFNIAKFPHEVLPPRKERFSIAGWE